MSKRVLVISDYRDFHSTRPEANIFIGLARQGFEIHIMTYADSPHVALFRAAGINVINFHPEKKFNINEIKKIRDYLIEKKIDIIQLYNSKAIINGIQAAKRLPIKIVLYRGYTGNIHWYDPTAYLKFLHPRVDTIVCNSKGVEKHFHRQLFFDKKKTVTILKGHSLKWYEKVKPANIRQQLGISEDSFMVVHVSVNRKMKGIPYLLKAFNSIPAKFPIHLLLVGSNMNTRKNMKIINSSPKKDRIHILGFRKDALNIVAASNAFVLPSIKGESITKAVLEAMSLGIPAIITDIPGNRELVEQGKSGIIVPVRNKEAITSAILQLHNDPELCKNLGNESKNRINYILHADQTINEMKKLYEAL